MFAAGQDDMRSMDRYTMEKLGLPGVVLMENAGAKAAEEIVAYAPRRVIVAAGGGNNGGDGFVIARRLHDAGVDALLCMLVEPERIKGDAKVHLQAYLSRGLPVLRFWEQGLEKLREELERADFIVDAMLGTGVRGPLREPFDRVIPLVNSFAGVKPILAVDIPSGLDSDSGKAEGAAVKAAKTVTFVFPKKGFFLHDGPAHVGEWKAVDISVPPSAAEALHLDLPRVITEPQARSALPARPPHGHKGTFGHVLVVGGSRPFVGAPVYTAKAAFHSGAGLVTLAVPEGIYPTVAGLVPEALFLPLPEKDGCLAENSVDALLPQLPRCSCAAIGPGIGRFEGGGAWIKSVLAGLQGRPVVFDADALYLLRGDLEAVRQYPGPVIFTPHPGEMAALLGKTVKEAEEDRLGTARAFARENRLFLLLKGHRSVIATPDGELFLNPYGHDALGKGGSGDVLTGLIASFLAQGAAPADALVAASCLHARGGEIKAETLSRYGVTPLDVIDAVKEQLSRWSHAE